MGVVVGSNKPQDIGREKLVWNDNNNRLHSLTLEDSPRYPLSPMNDISVSKLGVDHNDVTLNMQKFSSYSAFTWDMDESSMVFKNGASNLPELNMRLSFRYDGLSHY